MARRTHHGHVRASVANLKPAPFFLTPATVRGLLDLGRSKRSVDVPVLGRLSDEVKPRGRDAMGRMVDAAIDAQAAEQDNGPGFSTPASTRRRRARQALEPNGNGQEPTCAISQTEPECLPDSDETPPLGTPLSAEARGVEADQGDAAAAPPDQEGEGQSKGAGDGKANPPECVASAGAGEAAAPVDPAPNAGPNLRPAPAFLSEPIVRALVSPRRSGKAALTCVRSPRSI